MHIIRPKPITWFGCSNGQGVLTLHLTTNPKPKDVLEEMTGSEAQVRRRLGKHQYFDLAINGERELEQLIQLATHILEGKRHGA